ncbi:MAG: hypothetical protein CMM80_04650 [Rhodospirillaceae bacterium]|nr:hypothetical protein [Rhodospirillaceae bacterium]
MKNLVNRGNYFAFPIVVFLIISPAYAHKCILEGNTAADISRYNSCKADLQIASMHAESQSQATLNELDQLRAENTLLEAKLVQLRRQLLSILADF